MAFSTAGEAKAVKALSKSVAAEISQALGLGAYDTIVVYTILEKHFGLWASVEE